MAVATWGYAPGSHRLLPGDHGAPLGGKHRFTTLAPADRTRIRRSARTYNRNHSIPRGAHRMPPSFLKRIHPVGWLSLALALLMITNIIVNIVNGESWWLLAILGALLFVSFGLEVYTAKTGKTTFRLGGNHRA